MVSQTGKTEWACLSTDAKGELGVWGNGHKMTEIDTGKIYYYDAVSKNWVEPASETNS